MKGHLDISTVVVRHRIAICLLHYLQEPLEVDKLAEYLEVVAHRTLMPLARARTRAMSCVIGEQLAWHSLLVAARRCASDDLSFWG